MKLSCRTWNEGMVDIIISNTSPLLYLHRIEALDWLPKLGDKVWIPQASACTAIDTTIPHSRIL